jgi:cholesterol transport system auxiliary component
MLAPLIVAALDQGHRFRAVVATPSAAAGDLRLDTEILRLQHEFGGSPSRVRLTLRATLTDNATRQVLGQLDFDAQADAPSEDAYGGVVAANHATRVVLQQLTDFCSQAAQQWQPRDGTPAKRAVGRL